MDQLPSSSTLGYVGIKPKILKDFPDFFVPLLHLLFKDCLKLKSIPEDESLRWPTFILIQKLNRQI